MEDFHKPSNDRYHKDEARALHSWLNDPEKNKNKSPQLRMVNDQESDQEKASCSQQYPINAKFYPLKTKI